MELTPAPKTPTPVGRDSSGIALFMVLAAVSVLAILVTEFSYIAQVGQAIAFGGLDQTRAHYIAKSGLKLSLLRLKAYQQVKAISASLGGASGIGIPKNLINQIWSFPFFYPIPTNVPGMRPTDKALIENFQKESGFDDGKFSAIIESESSKYNLNTLLPGFAATPTPTPSTATGSNPNATPTPTPTGPPGSQTPTAQASFTPEGARENLKNFLSNVLLQKSETDPDFASLYRDFRIEDFVDTIAAWVDRKYERRTSQSIDKVIMKRAPFYSVSELRMNPLIDEDLYGLFAPTLRASAGGGLNINTMGESTLRALIPQLTITEAKEFFKFRDSTEKDNNFGTVDEFYKYLQQATGSFRTPEAIAQLQKNLAEDGIVLITEETQFKITVQAQVNASIRTIEAWVTLGSPTSPAASSANTSTPPGGTQNVSGNASSNTGTSVSPAAPDSGLRITFMKIL